MLVRYRIPARIPPWRRTAWFEDYDTVRVTAPVGLHWVVRAARWAFHKVQYQIPLSLQPEFLGYPRIYPPWAWMKWVESNVAVENPWYGLCWAQYDPAHVGVHCRYVAPIGLNLVYALLRRALTRE